MKIRSCITVTLVSAMPRAAGTGNEVPRWDELGFWALAQSDPDRVALVTPHGEELRAGDVLAEANRLVHGLRAWGLSHGGTAPVPWTPNAG